MGELIDRDAEHLRLLKLCYYMLAAMTGFFSLLFALFFALFGAVLSSRVIPANQHAGSQADPRMLGPIFLSLAAVPFVTGGASAFLTFFTARSLSDHRRRTFCLVISALCCLSIPWGTVIGVCTILVLNRPSVKLLFDQQPAPGTP